jgi:hypothetical protein
MKTLQPSNGVHWSLAELQTLVGGYIEVAKTTDGKYLVLDEEGKLKRKPLNVAATRIYQYGRRDPVVGDVVLVDTLLEMEGPEEEAEEEE